MGGRPDVDQALSLLKSHMPSRVPTCRPSAEPTAVPSAYMKTEDQVLSIRSAKHLIIGLQEYFKMNA
jgi:hypothetical protein